MNVLGHQLQVEFRFSNVRIFNALERIGQVHARHPDLFQRTGSKQQLMLMALQPERTVINEVERGVVPGVPVREQLGAQAAVVTRQILT